MTEFAERQPYHPDFYQGYLDRLRQLPTAPGYNYARDAQLAEQELEVPAIQAAIPAPLYPGLGALVEESRREVELAAQRNHDRFLAMRQCSLERAAQQQAIVARERLEAAAQLVQSPAPDDDVRASTPRRSPPRA